MTATINIVAGLIVLGLGFPIGNLLAKTTKEELKAGRFWFSIICILGLLGTLTGLMIGDDAVLFTSAFIAIVASRSLKKPEKQARKRRRK